MKIRQTLRHVAAKQSLTLPWVGEKVRGKLVDLHVEHFLDRAPEEQQDTRRDRLRAFFDATMDTYLAALDHGYPEAKAREITHLQANLEFLLNGWTEMMEIPPGEVPEHVQRYAAFLDEHGISPQDPLGTFEPPNGLPWAPRTPEKLDDPDAPYAQAGYADATYVEDEDGTLRTE